ncbi:MAG: hypothetical protein P1T08_09055 [Acidimicrobiia bacterium]|nr:hypothetical protein [Acidimicrobiia bacterium]
MPGTPDRRLGQMARRSLVDPAYAVVPENIEIRIMSAPPFESGLRQPIASEGSTRGNIEP